MTYGVFARRLRGLGFSNDAIEDRAAYEKAARLYNSLVPDSAAVPLF